MQIEMNWSNDPLAMTRAPAAYFRYQPDPLLYLWEDSWTWTTSAGRLSEVSLAGTTLAPGKDSDLIRLSESSKKLPILEPAKEFASHQNSPNWLEIERDNYKGRVLALPKREDINLPVNEQLIVELYSK